MYSPFFARVCEEFLFNRRQGVLMVGCPAFRLFKRPTAQQQIVGLSLMFPDFGLALQDAEPHAKPFGIIGLNRGDQAVMRQLVPGRAAPLFGADQMRVN